MSCNGRIDDLEKRMTAIESRMVAREIWAEANAPNEQPGCKPALRRDDDAEQYAADAPPFQYDRPPSVQPGAQAFEPARCVGCNGKLDRDDCCDECLDAKRADEDDCGCGPEPCWTNGCGAEPEPAAPRCPASDCGAYLGEQHYRLCNDPACNTPVMVAAISAAPARVRELERRLAESVEREQAAAGVAADNRARAEEAERKLADAGRERDQLRAELVNYKSARIIDMERERELRDKLAATEQSTRDLLAVIHRDGGHRQEEIGDLSKACEDAAQLVLRERSDAAEAGLFRRRGQTEVDQLRDKLAAAEKAERAALDRMEDADREFDRVRNERDQLRAEMEVARAEVMLAMSDDGDHTDPPVGRPFGHAVVAESLIDEAGGRIRDLRGDLHTETQRHEDTRDKLAAANERIAELIRPAACPPKPETEPYTVEEIRRSIESARARVASGLGTGQTASNRLAIRMAEFLLARVAHLTESRIDAARIGYKAGHHDTVEGSYGDPDDQAATICEDLDADAAIQDAQGEGGGNG
jgi:hypothetical protein